MTEIEKKSINSSNYLHYQCPKKGTLNFTSRPPVTELPKVWTLNCWIGSDLRSHLAQPCPHQAIRHRFSFFHFTMSRKKWKSNTDFHFSISKKNRNWTQIFIFHFGSFRKKNKNERTIVNFYFPCSKLKKKKKIELRLSFFVFQFSEKNEWP